MVTRDRPIVLMNVTAMWAVDAALFAAIALGFLLWGAIERRAVATILTWAVMAILMMLLDRLAPLLPGTAVLAQAHERPPEDAVRRPVVRYVAEVSTVMAVGVVAIAAVTVYLGAQPAIAAGLMTAYCVSRLRGLATARDIERTSAVRLSVRLQRSVWRKRAPAFYATPRLA
jgi:hypothetical protein